MNRIAYKRLSGKRSDTSMKMAVDMSAGMGNICYNWLQLFHTTSYVCQNISKWIYIYLHIFKWTLTGICINQHTLNWNYACSMPSSPGLVIPNATHIGRWYIFIAASKWDVSLCIQWCNWCHSTHICANCNCNGQNIVQRNNTPNKWMKI